MDTATLPTGGSDIGLRVMFRVAEGLTNLVLGQGELRRDGAFVRMEHVVGPLTPVHTDMVLMLFGLRDCSPTLTPLANMPPSAEGAARCWVRATTPGSAVEPVPPCTSRSSAGTSGITCG